MIDRDKLARALGISPEEQVILDSGCTHSYHCKCETCRLWWKQMGKDDSTGCYGPFTDEEIEGKEDTKQ